MLQRAICKLTFLADPCGIERHGMAARIPSPFLSFTKYLSWESYLQFLIIFSSYSKLFSFLSSHVFAVFALNDLMLDLY